MSASWVETDRDRLNKVDLEGIASGLGGAQREYGITEVQGKELRLELMHFFGDEIKKSTIANFLPSIRVLTLAIDFIRSKDKDYWSWEVK